MAFLDYHGLQKFTSQFKAWLDSIFVKTVNSTAPDSTGNVTIDKVAFADNFIADDAQSSSGEFITRTSGGEASIADGDAWLNIIRGNRVHSGFSAREVNMTVTPAGMVDRDGTITAAIDRATFVEAASESATISLHYSNAWDMNPAMYGITVTGTPADGDTISVDYTKEVLNLAVNAAHRVAPAGIAATLNKATFIAYVAGAGTYTLSYTTVWSEDPTLYGVTVTGTPENGDSIVITYDGTNDPEMTVNSSRQADSAITATINRATFIAYVDHDATITLDYTDSWSADPALYGVTVTGTPINGDQIVITYVKEVIDMTVSAVSQVVRTNPITATIDELAFDNAVQSDGTTTFSFTTEWNLNPASYGITVTNTPVNGDTIVVSCVKEVRGTIKTFNPVEFYSTNWNLYNHTLGYARTVKYSSSYGFILGGTFTSAKFSTTNDSEAVKTPVDLVDIGDGMYYFEVSEDGFVWLEGANDTDTYLFMTWSDWQSGPPATFAAHEASTIDLSSVMSELFPYGLMRVGSVEDEINLSLQTAYSRIERMAYSVANLAAAKASGRAYEYDEDYIYIVREEPVSSAIELDGLYTANDHGLEVFTGTTVPGYAQMLYGQNLKDKLRTDVLTISAQTLSTQQKAQARTNIGAVGSVNGITGDAVVLPTDNTPVSGSDHYVTSGGVYTELAAINNRIGNVESPASVFNDVAFTIPTTAWSGSGTFTAIVSNSSISSTSGIWVFYDSSYNSYAKAPISSSVTSGGGSVTFTTTTKPTAAISGYIRIVDSVNGIIPVARGGTGAATPTDARSNLGCGNAATYGVANNLTTTAAGSSVLDAYQGKLLSDDISTLSSNLTYEEELNKAGDKINITPNWGQGGINDDGTLQGNSYKIRTGYVDLSIGDIVALSDLKYKLQFFVYNSDGTFVEKTNETQLYVVEAPIHCRIVMQRVNPIYSILPSEGSAILFCHNANADVQKISTLEEKSTELYTLSDLLAFNGAYSFPASFYARGRYSGGYPVYDITYRANMPNVVRLGYDAVITPVDNSFRVQVLLYNSSDVFVGIEEITSAKSVPKNQGFRISILRRQESTSEIADLYEFARAVEVSSFLASATGEKYVLQTVPFAEYKIDAKLYKMDNSYVSLIKPRDNFIRVANGVTVYMAVNGNDENDGLSSANPKKTFASAVAVQNVQTIILAEGTYEAGTHFTNGEEITVPVNMIGVGNVTIKNGHFSTPITFKNSLYCENITFYWGNNAIIVQYDSYDKIATFYKCRFEKSGVNNGLYALGGLTYVIECEATNNASDGFNYHKNSSILNHAIEINCKSSFNGDGNNYSSNATTTHNGNYIVRVNGDYKCCYGGVVADQEAYSANYGCSTGISTVTDESEHADKMANYWCSSAVMYLFDCVSYGSKYDTATIGTGEIISNVEYESNYTDS